MVDIFSFKWLFRKYIFVLLQIFLGFLLWSIIILCCHQLILCFKPTICSSAILNFNGIFFFFKSEKSYIQDKIYLTLQFPLLDKNKNLIETRQKKCTSSWSLFLLNYFWKKILNKYFTCSNDVLLLLDIISLIIVPMYTLLLCGNIFLGSHLWVK